MPWDEDWTHKRKRRFPDKFPEFPNLSKMRSDPSLEPQDTEARGIVRPRGKETDLEKERKAERKEEAGLKMFGGEMWDTSGLKSQTPHVQFKFMEPGEQGKALEGVTDKDIIKQFTEKGGFEFDVSFKKEPTDKELKELADFHNKLKDWAAGRLEKGASVKDVNKEIEKALRPFDGKRYRDQRLRTSKTDGSPSKTAFMSLGLARKKLEQLTDFGQPRRTITDSEKTTVSLKDDGQQTLTQIETEAEEKKPKYEPQSIEEEKVFIEKEWVILVPLENESFGPPEITGVLVLDRNFQFIKIIKNNINNPNPKFTGLGWDAPRYYGFKHKWSEGAGDSEVKYELKELKRRSDMGLAEYDDNVSHDQDDSDWQPGDMPSEYHEVSNFFGMSVSGPNLSQTYFDAGGSVVWENVWENDWVGDVMFSPTTNPWNPSETVYSYPAYTQGPEICPWPLLGSGSGLVFQRLQWVTGQYYGHWEYFGWGDGDGFTAVLWSKEVKEQGIWPSDGIQRRNSYSSWTGDYGYLFEKDGAESGWVFNGPVNQGTTLYSEQHGVWYCYNFSNATDYGTKMYSSQTDTVTVTNPVDGLVNNRFSQFSKWAILFIIYPSWSWSETYSPGYYSSYWGYGQPGEGQRPHYDYYDYNIDDIAIVFDDGYEETIEQQVNFNVYPNEYPTFLDWAIYDDDKGENSNPIYIGSYHYTGTYVGDSRNPELEKRYSLFYRYKTNEIKKSEKYLNVGNFKIDAFNSFNKYGMYWNGRVSVATLETTRKKKTTLDEGERRIFP